MENKTKKEDKRIVYTKMFLKEALLALMAEKPIEKITVTELCRKADINRNTFYTHYYSVTELLAEVEDELLSNMVQEIQNTEDNLNGYLCNVCNMVWSKREVFCVLFKEESSERLWTKIVNTCHDKVLESWREIGMTVSDEQLEMIFNYIVFGSLQIMKYWLTSNVNLTPSEVGKIIGTLSDNGISFYTK